MQKRLNAMIELLATLLVLVVLFSPYILLNVIYTFTGWFWMGLWALLIGFSELIFSIPLIRGIIDELFIIFDLHHSKKV